jgi:hypothetical protein
MVQVVPIGVGDEAALGEHAVVPDPDGLGGSDAHARREHAVVADHDLSVAAVVRVDRERQRALA